ncbi:helix-turn-helix transcriptional regulator [Serratia inhibens]|uniref:helix-turn-helix transcriptional regulator n=1 Tax=Serratia inhibens TaxID=2338073 RepID=UPI00025E39AC|nr:LuxR family transcriptional regulator [Serratia inhibens]ANS44544.1 HTH-type transcriptional regulator EcpR [Serratia inhibens PRI-2C]
MLNIAIKTQNEFYKLGLLKIIEKTTNSNEYILNSIDEECKSNISEHSNVIFTDLGANVNIFENNPKEGEDTYPYPQATIHITFHADGLFLEEISALISRVISLSKMNYKQLVRSEYFRKMMSRNNTQLSTKENHVLMLMGQGHNTNYISKILNCSQSTIYSHRRNAIKKLGMINRLQFYKYTLLLKDFCYRENFFLNL